MLQGFRSRAFLKLKIGLLEFSWLFLVSNVIGFGLSSVAFEIC